MTQTCCIDGCSNDSGGEVTLFKFPTSRTQRRKWLDAIKDAGRLADKLVAGSVLCSTHFRAEDYEDYKGRVRLKRKVVPTVFEGSTQPPSPLDPKPPQSSPNEYRIELQEEVEGQKENVQVEVPAHPARRTSDASEVNCIEVTPEIDTECPDPPTPEMDHRQDIEDILTNYHIKNTPGECPMHSPSPEPEPELESQPQPPTYIEISVEKYSNGDGGGRCSPQDDCLMVLESVQVEVDPGALMLEPRDHEEHEDGPRKEDHISLLTSSDEDDVIIQEPKIDTVEVSDETDEDDMPLVKLVKDKHQENFPKTAVLNKVFWGVYEYYCMECHYTTSNNWEYKKHRETHAKVLQVCDLCSYTTASESQFSKHKRKHKDDRSFKCHFCDFRAKHNMSLIYHLKTHKNANLAACTKGFKCTKCDFKSNLKTAVLKHVRSCNKRTSRSEQYSCEISNCNYVTKRATDLKRHKRLAHRNKTNKEDSNSADT